MAVARPTTHDDEPVEKVESLDDLRRIAADVQYDHRPRLVSIAGGGNITGWHVYAVTNYTASESEPRT